MIASSGGGDRSAEVPTVHPVCSFDDKAHAHCVAAFEGILLDRVNVRESRKEPAHDIGARANTVDVADESAMPLQVSGKYYSATSTSCSVRKWVMRSRTISVFGAAAVTVASQIRTLNGPAEDTCRTKDAPVRFARASWALNTLADGRCRMRHSRRHGASASAVRDGAHKAAAPRRVGLLPERVVGVLAIGLPLASQRRLRLTRRAVPLVVASGVCEVLGFGLFTIGARHNIASTAVLSSQLSALAAAVEYLLFGERLLGLKQMLTVQ
jgi:hypothetical protein